MRRNRRFIWWRCHKWKNSSIFFANWSKLWDKKKTGKSPIEHALNYVKKEVPNKNKSCPSFDSKKDLEICLMVKERIALNQAKIKKNKFTDKPSKELTSSLRFSINDKSKIKYLD